MHRFGKLLLIIFILGFVFFIICDEKGYRIQWNKDRVVFNEVEKKSELIKEEKNNDVTKLQPTVVYKNADYIRIYPGFQNPKNLRNSDGMDPEFLAKLDNDINSGKESYEEDKVKVQESEYTGSNLTSKKDENSISNLFQSGAGQHENRVVSNADGKQYDGSKYISENSDTILGFEGYDNDDNIDMTEFSWNDKDQEAGFLKFIDYKIEKYQLSQNSFDLKKGVSDGSEGNQRINLVKSEINQLIQNPVDLKKGVTVGEGNQKMNLVKREKYQLSQNSFDLKKGQKNHQFVVDNSQNTGIGMSDSMLQGLLENEEIDFDTLESENDEFLQKVFDKTKDTSVMNLIVETYLNEYQFIKAKKFIDSLPEMYIDDLKPLLNLRVAFNSFALTSKTSNSTLTSIVQNYKTKNLISEEDGNWYLGVVALMQRDYDEFFAISNKFTSEVHKLFATKLQGYKDQISKQMGMPDYYFDTLVALELFNQGLFQPAKVLALYSLQQNSNYILPHQILAYANFLTNSRDTSIEYLKKLVDLDRNNAEKYRFLMGVAYYRAGNYEQSVTMLSTIQNEKLRLDTQRYLINDYLQLDQKNKLIASRNKLLGYENLVASDFYTYFYEVFYHPYSQGGQYQLFAFDTELTNKMLRVCSMKLSDDERAVCTYGSIGRNIALGKFDGLEQYLLDLTSQYPQGYLYQALGEYYIQQGDNEKAKMYLLKASSMINNKSEISQVKKLLQDIM